MMKRNKSRIVKALSALAILGVIVAGIAALTTTATARVPPGPLCGPTILFECTFPDGSTQLVGLTRCEVGPFEKKNGATCEPFSF